MAMATFAHLSREERIGLGIAAAAHVALVAAIPRPIRSSRERWAKEAMALRYGASTEPWVTREILLPPARLSSPITAMTRP